MAKENEGIGMNSRLNKLMDKELKLLETLQEMPVNPFLFQKIQQRIAARKQELLPASWSWAIAACLLLLISFNVKTLVHYKHKNNTLEVFSLNTQNELYHE